MEGKKIHDHQIASRKATDRINHTFMTEALSKLGIEETCLGTMKVIYENPTAYIILNFEN